MKVTEKFDEFKPAGGYTLPHLYTINYLTDSNSGVFEYVWKVSIAEYQFDRKLAADFFSFQ
jgi:hypothetical protein